MAKTSSIEKNLKRINLVKKFSKKRKALKKIVKNRKLTLDERFEAQLKLAKIPRNSAKIRIRNRCEITGRSHGVYRKLKISRIALRELAASGKLSFSLVDKDTRKLQRVPREMIDAIKG